MENLIDDMKSPAIAAELQRLRADLGEELPPEEVVDAARHPDSPLHRCFEWDDDVAADKFRLLQATKLLQVYRVEKTTSTPRSVRYAATKPVSKSKPTLRKQSHKDDSIATRAALLELEHWANRNAQAAPELVAAIRHAARQFAPQDLTDVPTIGNSLARKLQVRGDKSLTEDEEDELSRSIEAATAVLRARKLGALT